MTMLKEWEMKMARTGDGNGAVTWLIGGEAEDVEEESEKMMLVMVVWVNG